MAFARSQPCSSSSFSWLPADNHEANTRNRRRIRTLDPAATGRREEAPPGDLAERQPRGRVLLAARRQAREPGDAGVRQGRERLRRRDAGAHQGARNQGVRGDHRPAPAGRFHRAVPHERLLVLPALRNRQGIPDLRAPQGHEGSARGNPARRQRDGEGPRFLRGRRHRDQPGQQAAGLGRRHRRPPAVRGARQESRDARGPAHRDPQRGEQHRLGRRQQELPLHREGSGDAARLQGAQSTIDSARTTRRAPIRWSGSRTTTASTRGVGDTKDEKYLVIHTQSTVSSEAWFADATDPKLAFKVFLPRERDHEYQVEHANGRWIVRTNWQAKNFRIVGGQARRRRRPREVAGPRRASRRCVRRRVRRVQALPRHRGAFGRPAQAAHPSLGWRQGRVRHRRRAQLHHGARREPRVRQRQAALHLHLAGHAAHHLRLRLQDRRARAAEARARARRLRPGQLLHRVRLGDGARRHEGAGAHRVPQGHAARRHARRCCRSVTARTAPPTTRSSHSCRRRCSTAASSSPSRTSAAARRWAAPGTRTASCSTRRTPSPISSTSRAGWSRTSYADRIARVRAGALGRRPAHGRDRRTWPRRTTAASSPACRSSTW